MKSNWKVKPGTLSSWAVHYKGRLIMYVDMSYSPEKALEYVQQHMGITDEKAESLIKAEEEHDDMLDGINGTSDEDFMTFQYEDEQVVSPDHYTVGGHEALAVIKAKLTPEEYRGYCKGNSLKYLMRANYKGHHNQDCEKAEYYIQELCNVNDEASTPDRDAFKVRTDYSNSPPF